MRLGMHINTRMEWGKVLKVKNRSLISVTWSILIRANVNLFPCHTFISPSFKSETPHQTPPVHQRVAPLSRFEACRMWDFPIHASHCISSIAIRLVFPTSFSIDAYNEGWNSMNIGKAWGREGFLFLVPWGTSRPWCCKTNSADHGSTCLVQYFELKYSQPHSSNTSFRALSCDTFASQ